MSIRDMHEDHNPERNLALTYASQPQRASLQALLGLDDSLAALLRTTSEPAIAQIRLAWWRERLAELGTVATPAMPVLERLKAEVIERGIAGAQLVEIVEGWEVLIENEQLDLPSLAIFAQKRGGALFSIAADLLGGSAMPGAGEGWALADLASNVTMPGTAKLAGDMARERLDRSWRWPRETRALGGLAMIAKLDLALPGGTRKAVGSPRRVARLAWMRLTGR